MSQQGEIFEFNNKASKNFKRIGFLYVLIIIFNVCLYLFFYDTTVQKILDAGFTVPFTLPSSIGILVTVFMVFLFLFEGIKMLVLVRLSAIFNVSFIQRAVPEGQKLMLHKQLRRSVFYGVLSAAGAITFIGQVVFSFLSANSYRKAMSQIGQILGQTKPDKNFDLPTRLLIFAKYTVVIISVVFVPVLWQMVMGAWSSNAFVIPLFIVLGISFVVNILFLVGYLLVGVRVKTKVGDLTLTTADDSVIDAIDDLLETYEAFEKEGVGKKVTQETPKGYVFCRECGTRNKPDAKFCVECGKVIQHAKVEVVPQKVEIVQEKASPKIPVETIKLEQKKKKKKKTWVSDYIADGKYRTTDCSIDKLVTFKVTVDSTAKFASMSYPKMEVETRSRRNEIYIIAYGTDIIDPNDGFSMEFEKVPDTPASLWLNEKYELKKKREQHFFAFFISKWRPFRDMLYKLIFPIMIAIRLSVFTYAILSAPFTKKNINETFYGIMMKFWGFKQFRIPLEVEL